MDSSRDRGNSFATTGGVKLGFYARESSLDTLADWRARHGHRHRHHAELHLRSARVGIRYMTLWREVSGTLGNNYKGLQDQRPDDQRRGRSATQGDANVVGAVATP